MVGILEYGSWLNVKRISSENSISFMESLTDKRAQIFSELLLRSDFHDLPDQIAAIICPNLGVILFRSKELSSSCIINNVQGSSLYKTIEYLEESGQFDIITPVSDYEELSVLGGEIPTWHHELVGIDKLHSQRLTGRNVQIGVLDSGVGLNVSYLSDRIVAYASFEADEPVIGGQMSDSLKHGTHVCGIIAGHEIGVAPEASLVVCKIAPAGYTTFDRIVLALEWLCADFPRMQVINMSIGKLDDPSPGLKKIIARLQQLDKILVCAIGNKGEGITYTPGNMPEAIGVGAVDIDKEVANFSSGDTWDESERVRSKPDLVMPGVEIPSCLPDGNIYLGSGTSQAAPMASGLIALILQAFPNLSGFALREKLLSLCRDLPVPPSRDGHGLPDASLLGRDLD